MRKTILIWIFLSTVSPITHAANGKAWAWVADAPEDFSTPNSFYRYNSFGGVIQVFRTGGAYSIRIPNAGGDSHSGIMLVSSYGTTTLCKSGGWYDDSTDIVGFIFCSDRRGTSVAGKFTVLFYRNSGILRKKQAYLLYETERTTIPVRQWNSQGVSNRVNKISTGHYRVILPFMTDYYYNLQLSDYGWQDGLCKIASTNISWTNRIVNVVCRHRVTHNFIDNRFVLSYTSGVDVESNVVENSDNGAHVYANRENITSYIPMNQINTLNNTNHIRRISQGQYQVSLPGLAPFASTHAQISTVGDNSHRCHIRSWGFGTTVNVECFTPTGTYVDAKFYLLYLTDDPIFF